MKNLMVLTSLLSVFTMNAYASCDTADMKKLVESSLNEEMLVPLEGRLLVVTKENKKFSIQDKDANTKRVYATFNWKTQLETFSISGTNVFVADLDVTKCELLNGEMAVVR